MKDYQYRGIYNLANIARELQNLSELMWKNQDDTESKAFKKWRSTYNRYVIILVNELKDYIVRSGLSKLEGKTMKEAWGNVEKYCRRHNI